MKPYRIIAALIVCLSGTSAVWADDTDLFSDVRSTTVYGSGTDNELDPPTARRVTLASEIVEMLNATGFSAKSEGSRIATTQKQLDPWTFPVLLMVAEDENSVAIMMGLKTKK